MWIPKKAWDQLFESLGELERDRDVWRVKAETAEKQLAIERNNADWLRTNANVANFRADALFQQMTAARLPTPAYERAPSAAQNNVDESSEMMKGGALPSLEDPGDELAQKLGIDHAADGSLVYR